MSGFPGINAIHEFHVPLCPEGAPLPEVPAADAFRTIRIKVSGTDRVLQLGTMAAAHVPGSRPFLTDTKNAAEFPNLALAMMVCRLIEDRLNASGATRWSLTVERVHHERTDAWPALYRMDRTALEMAYLMAESLPNWVKR